MDLDQTLNEALALGDEGRWAEMAELLLAALRQQPDDAHLLCWLGVAYREAGQDGIAYQYFRRCWEQDPLDPHVLAMCGAGLAAFDDPEAEAALRAAVLSGPEVPIARLQYGAYLAREGMFESALEHLKAALELEPEDPATQGEFAIALALKGDYTSAVAAFERTLEQAPDDSWSRVLLGLVYSELEEAEPAAETLLQAAAERPDDAEAQVLAALSAAAVGWLDAAGTSLARAEYATENVDPELLEEAHERLEEGADAARAFLRETLGPAALHDRLLQPI
ncbi:MAG: tetratricopeptide repeat protein [Longimicrobiales bacterium]